jgi:hypothetical protein
MKKKLLFSFLIVLVPILCFISCRNDDSQESANISGIKGLVQKGPFVSGSSVSIYELDNNLNATGRVFEAKTDNEGAFSVTTSTSLVSKYVKLSVTGFYFNEYTGRLSDAPVSLEAISSIDNVNNANINVNILTHLEMPRVINLVSSGKSFQEAKQQAQKELLNSFLITNQSIKPEEASITANNTSANILIAISSILLNERSDAQFTEFMSTLRNDLSDGTITQDTKNEIARSSFELSYSNIKNNIKKRYEELGKTVEVGNFELFIDGNGDGQIGDAYDEIIHYRPDPIMPNDAFTSEQAVREFCAASVSQLYTFIQNQYLFDGVYTNTVSSDDLNHYYELKSIYEHNLTSYMALPMDLWSSTYKAIRYDNLLIEKSGETNLDWFKKYQYYSRTFRAYKYLNMITLWGDVPLVISLNNIDGSYSFVRTPQKEVLDFVINELESVYQNLPESSSQFECSKYFSKAIQARAFLQNKEYNRALEAANIIINSGKYSLSNDINSIYAGNNKENIFELPNSDDYSSIPYRDLIKKGDNIAVCRYSEILLIASEANLKLGNANQAIIYLNQVRNRNGRASIDNSSNIEDALINEWKEDLKNEGLYFYALKRFDKAKQVLGISGNKLLLPIPISEMNANPKITQNPGY